MSADLLKHLIYALEDVYGYLTLSGEEWRMPTILTDIPQLSYEELVRIGLLEKMPLPTLAEAQTERSELIANGQWKPVHEQIYNTIPILLRGFAEGGQISFYKLSELGWNEAKRYRQEGKFVFFHPIG